MSALRAFGAASFDFGLEIGPVLGVDIAFTQDANTRAAGVALALGQAARRVAAALHPTKLRGRAHCAMFRTANTLNLYCIAVWHHRFAKLTFWSLSNIPTRSV